MIDKRPESPCKIYCVDVLESGEFKTLDLRTICDTEASRKDFWTMMHKKVNIATSFHFIITP